MKRHALLPTLTLSAMMLATGWGGQDPVVPAQELDLHTSLSVAYTDACRGQATAAFAQMGEMGERAGQQETPRIGLARLAGEFFHEGVLSEPTLQSLAAFLVEVDPDLSVEACM